MGSEYKGSKKYAVKYADADSKLSSCKKFYNWEGGAVLSNNKEIINKLSEIRTMEFKDHSEKLFMVLRNEWPWF